MVMGADAKIGDRVKYLGCSPVQVTGHDNPRGILTIGQIYILQRVEASSWHTDFYLQGIDGNFNSVCFDRVDQSFVNGFIDQEVLIGKEALSAQI